MKQRLFQILVWVGLGLIAYAFWPLAEFALVVFLAVLRDAATPVELLAQFWQAFLPLVWIVLAFCLKHNAIIWIGGSFISFNSAWGLYYALQRK